MISSRKHCLLRAVDQNGKFEAVVEWKTRVCIAAESASFRPAPVHVTAPRIELPFSTDRRQRRRGP